MVAVGDVHLAIGHRRGDPLMRAGIRQAPDPVNGVTEMRLELRCAGIDRVELAVDDPGRVGVEAEHLRQVHVASARQLEPVQPRAGEGPLVGQHDALVEAAQPDATDEALARVLPAADGENLVVPVEGGSVVAAEDPILEPAAQLAGSVPVLPFAISLRKIDADDVERALRLQLAAVRFGDHVVGRRDQ